MIAYRKKRISESRIVIEDETPALFNEKEESWSLRIFLENPYVVENRIKEFLKYQ